MIWSDINYLQTGGAILSFIIPLGQLLCNKNEKWYKRITPLGWGCLAVSLYLGCVTYLGNKVHQKEISDSDSTRKSDKKEILDSIGKRKGDTTTIITDRKTIIYSKDSLNYYGIPNVQIDSVNSFYTTEKGIKSFIKFHNLSTTDGYNFNAYVTGIFKFEGIFFVAKQFSDYENLTISANQSFIYYFSVPNNRKINFDTVYYYIKFTYSNYYKHVIKRDSSLVVFTFSNNFWGYASQEIKESIIDSIKRLNFLK